MDATWLQRWKAGIRPQDQGFGADAAATAAEPGARDPLAAVLDYHQQTKHRFLRQARGPDVLDWANQPDPFRRYEGSPLIYLPRLAADEAPDSPPYEALYRAGAIASMAVSAASLSRFLECSLAISAWKQAGDVRWALRANPSSGNLHPTEAYLLIDRIEGLSSVPGLYHYAPREHGLELRADGSAAALRQLLEPFPPHAFLLGLSSVNWRESWKYGERAFRYCQHDIGHALGSARIAAQLLGWRMALLDGTSDDSIAALLGLDRAADFAGAEREHPGCLAVVWPDAQAHAATAAAPGRRALSIPLFIDADTVRDLPSRRWLGQANRLSRSAGTPWEMIARAERASWKTAQQRQTIVLLRDASGTGGTGHIDDGQPSLYPQTPKAAQMVRQRRSALAFDPTASIPAACFYRLLERVMPRAARLQCRQPMPWDVLPWAPAIHLALFVHRVEGLVPGLYLLARDAPKAPLLRHAMHPWFVWRPPAACPDRLPLFLLREADMVPLATQLSCGQALAGDSAFSLGMIAEFLPRLRLEGPSFYRRLLWETGVLGQVLYLEAEALGLRATGIGCFFDDPVHQTLGFTEAAFQSLYHFAIGHPRRDERLTTLAPYATRTPAPVA